MIGKRLKQLRGDRTQAEIAKKLKISRARYSHYENERNEPDAETLQKLADFFNVTTDYLLGRSDHPAPTCSANSPHKKESKDLKQLISENKTLHYGGDVVELDEETKAFFDQQMHMVFTYVKERNKEKENNKKKPLKEI